MNNKTIRSMVPIERPHITLDPYYDNPMSATRRYITSTDPIEGTRASLKRKRNVYCPSLFEKLPYELREQVYALLGLPIRGKVVQECREGSHCRNNSHFIMKDYGNLVTKVHLENMEVSATITSINWDRALHNSSPNTYGTIRGLDGLYNIQERDWSSAIGLMGVNHRIRSEVMELFCKNAVVKFSFDLSKKRIHYDNWHNAHNWQSKPGSNRAFRPRGFFKAMQLPIITFTRLQHVYLSTGFRLDHGERPHALRVAKKQWRSPLIHQANSIRFIASNCPMLKTLRVKPPECSLSQASKRGLDIMTCAFVGLVRECIELQSVTLQRTKYTTYIREDGPRTRTMYGTEEEDEVIDLSTVPLYNREDVVEKWAASVLKDIASKWKPGPYTYR